ncbi:hypothetical protein NDU88_006902 [Pleurodeles waltl]|uniref:Uncharacterized protein n=1 Tax=Pleurodeles waltl TaxID=8319 RepID=A0AAV7N0R8_PLEWA|nr:hypothetical protein NDU88_006902 [Pleurodeles waltl]
MMLQLSPRPLAKRKRQRALKIAQQNLWMVQRLADEPQHKQSHINIVHQKADQKASTDPPQWRGDKVEKQQLIPRVPMRSKMRLVNAFIRTTMTYASPVWSGCKPEYRKPLQKPQKKAL